MYEELIVMMLFALCSLIISKLLLDYLPSPLNKIFQVLAIVGIIIHELCHVLMCFLTNTPIDRVKILERTKDNDKEGMKFSSFSGRVIVGENTKLAFLQALLIGLAPTYLSFWLFFFLWNLLSVPNTDIALVFIYFFLMISIFLGATPSVSDLVSISKTFSDDPYYSLYQILLLFISGFSVWLIVMGYEIVLFHEIFYYGLIFIGYYVLKYSFRGINGLYHNLLSKMGIISKDKIKFKKLTRRRYKPINPKKLGVEEPHW